MNGAYDEVVYVGIEPVNEQQLDGKLSSSFPVPKPKQSRSFMKVTRDDSPGSGPNAQPFMNPAPAFHPD